MQLTKNQLNMRYQFGDCKLDSKSFELRRANKPIKLRRKTFELLSCLINKPGQVFTKDELIEQVWPDRVISDATLNSSMKEVRQAIGDDGKNQQLIQTLYGQGYKFIGKVKKIEHEKENAESQSEIQKTAPITKSSLAVLPFINLSGDREQEYFSDGISEDIITELSKFRSLSVIARNSSFQFRNNQDNIKLVGEELGVRYVLEGSVRKSVKRIRITAQLVDTQTGHHIWADKFDRHLEDVFEIQDEVARCVVAITAERIEDSQYEIAKQKRPTDMRAYDFWLRGKRAYNENTLEGMDRAIELFKQSIEIAPNYARGYASLGLTYNMRTSFSGWGKPIDKAHSRALELARQAVKLDDSDHWNQFILGWCLLFKRKYGEAKRHYDLSNSINPNDAEALIYQACFLGYDGRHEEAMKCLDNAFELNPLCPDWFLDYAIAVHLTCMQPVQALELSYQSPKDCWPEMPGWLAVAHAYAGKIEDSQQFAQLFVKNIRRLWIGEGIPNDKECVEWFLLDNPIRKDETREWFIEGFRIAGLNV